MTGCYMCSAEANSIEHVPPRCIFPESKDLPEGVNYRKNLITVPSCEEHNLTKSGDDEYLLFVMTTNWSVNDIGLQHWKTKVLRSIKKRPAKYRIYKDPRPISINGVPTGYYRINFDRISEEIKRISRGIYYHHFNKQWRYPIGVVFPDAIAIHNTKANFHNTITRKTTNMLSNFLVNEPKLGDNSEIFYYQYKFDPEIPYYFLRMVFYGGIEVSTISPEKAPPYFDK